MPRPSPPRCATRSRASARARQLGDAYRTALAAYVPEDTTTIFAVDAQVRGIDRNLNQRIDALAESIQQAAQRQAGELRARGEREYDTLRAAVSVTAGVVILLAGVLAVIALRAPRSA